MNVINAKTTRYDGGGIDDFIKNKATNSNYFEFLFRNCG